MARINELRQQQATLTASIRELMDKVGSNEMGAEDKAALARMEGDFDALVARINQEQNQLDRERAAGETAKPGAPEAKGEQRKMFAAALTGNDRHVAEYRAQFTLTNDDQAGSLTAPMEFRRQLIQEVTDLVHMRRIANVLPEIGQSQTIGYPQLVNRATDAEWVSEVAAAPEENTLSFGRREFKPNRMAKMIILSRTLVSHASMTEPVVRAEMARVIAETQENGYLTGDGVNRPLGIFVASDNGIPASRDISEGNTATEVTFDGLINAKYSLKQQYLTGARWMMHRDLVKMLAKIKDGEGQYIWQQSVSQDVPDRVLGLPVLMSEFAPNTYTAGQYAAILGNFRHYWIVDADTLTVQVLRELYAITNQVGYLYNYSGDGAPVVGAAFARVKLGV